MQGLYPVDNGKQCLLASLHGDDTPFLGKSVDMIADDDTATSGHGEPKSLGERKIGDHYRGKAPELLRIAIDTCSCQ